PVWQSSKGTFVRERFYLVALVIFGWIFVAGPTAIRAGDNWPQWRGPNGNGTSDSTNLPTEWDLAKNKNIVWKAALPSWSGGTPVVWGDHIFLTSPNRSEGSVAPPQGGKGGRPMRDPGGQTLLMICLSKKDGSVRWQRELDHGNKTYN